MEIGFGTILTWGKVIWSAIISSGLPGLLVLFVGGFILVRDRHRLYRFVAPYASRSLDAFIRRWEFSVDEKEAWLGTAKAHEAAAKVLLAQVQKQASAGGGIRTSGELPALQPGHSLSSTGGEAKAKDQQSAQSPGRLGARSRRRDRPGGGNDGPGKR